MFSAKAGYYSSKHESLAKVLTPMFGLGYNELALKKKLRAVSFQVYSRVCLLCLTPQVVESEPSTCCGSVTCVGKQIYFHWLTTNQPFILNNLSRTWKMQGNPKWDKSRGI